MFGWTKLWLVFRGLGISWLKIGWSSSYHITIRHRLWKMLLKQELAPKYKWFPAQNLSNSIKLKPKNKSVKSSTKLTPIKFKRIGMEPNKSISSHSINLSPAYKRTRFSKVMATKCASVRNRSTVYRIIHIIDIRLMNKNGYNWIRAKLNLYFCTAGQITSDYDTRCYFIYVYIELYSLIKYDYFIRYATTTDKINNWDFNQFTILQFILKRVKKITGMHRGNNIIEDLETAKRYLQLRVDARRLRKISTNPILQAIFNQLLE